MSRQVSGSDDAATVAPSRPADSESESPWLAPAELNPGPNRPGSQPGPDKVMTQ